MSCLETYATLRIFSGSMHPDEIESMLGLAATRKAPRDQTSRYRHRREANGWFFSTEGSVDSRDNDVHLGAIITLLTPRAEALRRLQSLGCETDIFCYWVSSGQGGPGLEVKMMEHLCSLRLAISWDMYFGDESEYAPSPQFGRPKQSHGADGDNVGG